MTDSRAPNPDTRDVDPRPGGRRRRVPPITPGLVFGLLAPLAVGAFVLTILARFTIDDSFISYRYARNLALGHGLVFNVGEAIEGYTNFAWTVILAAGYRIGIDPDSLAKALGGLAALGAAVTTYALARRALPDAGLPPIAPWLLVTSPVLMGHSVFGLETGMFAFTMVAALWLMFREEEHPDEGRLRIPWSGLAFAFGALTRPEAPMFIGLGMLFLPGPALWSRVTEHQRARVMFIALLATAIGAFVHLKAGAHAPGAADAWYGAIGALVVLGGVALAIGATPRTFLGRRNLVRGALFVAPVGVHMLWRHSFYGSWLPNTFAAKTGNVAAQFGRGTSYVEGFMEFEGAIIWFAIAGLAFAFSENDREMMCVGITGLFGALVCVVVGGDWMKLWRFMAHVQPHWALMVCLGVRAAWRLRERWIQAALVVFLAGSLHHREAEGEAKTEFCRVPTNDFLFKSAKLTTRWFLDREARHGRDQVYGAIALGDIGEVAWVTDYPIEDLLGLVDPVISQLPGGYKEKLGPDYVDHVYEAAPRYILAVTARDTCLRPSHKTVRQVFRDPRFKATWEVAGIIQLPKVRWCVFERRDDAARMKALGEPFPSPAEVHAIKAGGRNSRRG